MRIFNFLLIALIFCLTVVYTQDQGGASSNPNDAQKTPEKVEDPKPSGNPPAGQSDEDKKKAEEAKKAEDAKKAEEEKKKADDAKKAEEDKKKDDGKKDDGKKDDDKKDDGKKDDGKKDDDKKDDGKKDDGKKDDKKKEEDTPEWEEIDMEKFKQPKDSDNVILYPVYPTNNSRTVKSGDQIKVLWCYKIPETDMEKKNFIFKMRDIEKIQVDYMTGSNMQNVFIEKVGDFKSGTRDAKYTIPSTRYKGKYYFFRFTLIPKDKDAKPGLSWTTRFDVFNTDKGKFLEITNDDPSTSTTVETFKGVKETASTYIGSFSMVSGPSTLLVILISGLASLLFI